MKKSKLCPQCERKMDDSVFKGWWYCEHCFVKIIKKETIDQPEEVQNEEKGEEYNFPDWITDEMKENFYGMWRCFCRTPKDYFEQKYTKLNNKKVSAIPLHEDKKYFGIYFHKWNNIGWLLLPNGEVKTVANPELIRLELQIKDNKERFPFDKQKCNHCYLDDICAYCGAKKQTQKEEKKICHICKKPIDELGEKYCSVGHKRPTPSEWKEKFRREFKQTDKNEVGYVPAYKIERLEQFIESLLDEKTKEAYSEGFDDVLKEIKEIRKKERVYAVNITISNFLKMNLDNPERTINIDEVKHRSIKELLN